MPHWFYRTVSQPILFRLPAPRARDLALGFIGGLARLPFGPFLIDFLGHMRADPRLRQSILDTDFPTAVGLGPWLDTRAIAVEALSRFGVGFIEIGPVTLKGSTTARPVRRLKEQEALWIDHDPGSISSAECNQRLSNAGVKVPVLVRIGDVPEEVTARLIRELNTGVMVILPTLDPEWSSELWSNYVDLVLTAAGSRKLLLSIGTDQDVETIGPIIMLLGLILSYPFLCRRVRNR